ncbi:MAG: hypothetical protein AMXMBFR8_23400 [Nevskiales bacterium]
MGRRVAAGERRIIRSDQRKYMKDLADSGGGATPAGYAYTHWPMAHDLVCWRCGASLAALSLPLRRLEECPSCRAELHVCRMCVAYDPRVARKCTEDDAEEVKAKEQANFCDYFRPRRGAFDSSLAAAERHAKDELAALFGRQGPNGASAEPTGAAEALFDPHRKTSR